MTNKEYLLSLTSEKMYEELRWLFNEYALGFTDSRQAIIDWLDAERIFKQPKGEWKYRGLGGWHCSICDEQAPHWAMSTTQYLSHYCPCCGARMRQRK